MTATSKPAARPIIDPHLAVALAASLVLMTISLGFARPGSTYGFSFLFLAPLVWGPYTLRRRLHLHPFHYLLFVLAVLLHDLGAFGFYRRTFSGIQFDVYVHFYFGFAAALVLCRALDLGLGFRGAFLGLAVVLALLGLAALHELVEYGSTLVLGPERGMLKKIEGELYDTQEDLLNNLLGCLIALALYSLSRWKSARYARKTASPTSPG